MIEQEGAQWSDSLLPQAQNSQTSSKTQNRSGYFTTFVLEEEIIALISENRFGLMFYSERLFLLRMVRIVENVTHALSSNIRSKNRRLFLLQCILIRPNTGIPKIKDLILTQKSLLKCRNVVWKWWGANVAAAAAGLWDVEARRRQPWRRRSTALGIYQRHRCCTFTFQFSYSHLFFNHFPFSC